MLNHAETVVLEQAQQVGYLVRSGQRVEVLAAWKAWCARPGPDGGHEWFDVGFEHVSDEFVLDYYRSSFSCPDPTDEERAAAAAKLEEITKDRGPGRRTRAEARQRA